MWGVICVRIVRTDPLKSNGSDGAAAADEAIVRSVRTNSLKSTGSDGADDTDANNTPRSGANSTRGTTVIDL